MRTPRIIFVAATSALVAGNSIASAQVSSGTPEAAQQNYAKKPTDKNTTDKPVNATDKPLQNDDATNRRLEGGLKSSR